MTQRTVGTAIHEVKSYRELLVNLTRRELRSRFRRSFLGWGWSFMQPALMTAISLSREKERGTMELLLAQPDLITQLMGFVNERR